MMWQRSETIHVHSIWIAALRANMRLVRRSYARVDLKLLHGFALLLWFQAIHPRAVIDSTGREGADTFSKENIIRPQVPTKVEHFHGTTVCAVHLHVGNKPPACCTELRCFTVACHFRT